LGIIVLSSLLTIRNIVRGSKQRLKFWVNLTFFLIVCLVSIYVGGYLRFHALRLNAIQPFMEDPDIVVGWLMLITLLLLTWFHWGFILTCMISIAIVYVFWGHLLSNPMLTHAEFSTSFSMSYMGMSTIGGIFWFVPLAADKIYFLIIFAALLIGIGMLPLVVELGKWMGCHVKGGAAFPAIVGSALTGAVMGQAVSNTMLTGQLTIPMMKKHDYPPDLAGAVEAVASTSGQFLPPILGLAAFIIAAFLNIPYVSVAMAATLPSFLFVGGVVIAILLAARRLDLGCLLEPVNKGMILRLLPTFVLSFSTVLVLLLLFYSPNIAALCGIGVMLIFSLVQGPHRPSLGTLKDGLFNGLEVCTVLCLLLLAIGPIAQMATTTNLAGKLSITLSGIVPHNLIFILMSTMVVSLILGMGLPTPVAYLVVALTLAPFLQELGVPDLLAHLFVFYFAVFSTISPPVAISCLAAAKLSHGSFLGTARDALKISIPTFLIPYAFVYNSDLLIFPKVTLTGLWVFALTLSCMFFLSVSLFRFFLRKLNPLEAIFALAVSLLGMAYLISHSLIVLVAYFILGFALLLWIHFAGRASVAGEPPPGLPEVEA
jgi:TRAP transporter 4TM/12TM fusion protein